MGKTVSWALLIFLLLIALPLAFKPQTVKAQLGIIYIRADGSIDPSMAPISTVDNVTYTLVGDILSDLDGILVRRSNVIIDGSGHTVQGTHVYDSRGIDLTGSSNVTVKNVTVEAFDSGIRLTSSVNNSINGNNVVKNYYGVRLDYSSNNIVSGNNITANGFSGVWLYLSFGNSLSDNNVTANNLYGVGLSSSFINSVFHNNFVNNTQQVYSDRSSNVWDDGYPPGGNYWSDYDGTDAYSGPYQNVTGSDGIGDKAYVIDANNTDHYPLVDPYVVPEFPLFLVLPLFMAGTLLAAILCRRRRVDTE